MILVLLINFIFLFNIVRILMTKLRASTTSETIQYRKAVKATLVLLPLLGITYMLFFVNPGEDEISQIVFIYFNSFLESFQGFFVSVFYCFLNSEVRSAVRKRWHRWQDKHSIRARVARAMSIPTSPTRVSFHSIKQSSAVWPQQKWSIRPRFFCSRSFRPQLTNSHPLQNPGITAMGQTGYDPQLNHVKYGDSQTMRSTSRTQTTVSETD